VADEEEEEEEEARQRFDLFLANKYEVKRNEEIRKRLVKHLEVPSLRKYDEVLSPSAWSAYGRFLRDVLSGSAQADELKKIIKQATDQLRVLLRTEAESLSKAAKTTAYVDKIDFQLTKEGSPVELLRNLTLAVSSGGRTEDIPQIGTGTQSAVMIGMLELCLRHRTSSGLRLFVVEEPELFLHPHSQRHVASLLRRIAAENSSYIIVTTHSPAILADNDIRDVIRVGRDAAGTRCRRLPPDYSELDKSEQILTTQTCEMFFCRKSNTYRRIVRGYRSSSDGSSDADC